MIPRRQSFVHDLSPKPFSPTQLLSSTVDPSSDESEIARFVENICSNGDCLHLRPQQRVPLPLPGKVVLLREGMLAIDAMPAKGKLQVLDFLVADDVLSAATVLSARRFAPSDHLRLAGLPGSAACQSERAFA